MCCCCSCCAFHMPGSCQQLLPLLVVMKQQQALPWLHPAQRCCELARRRHRQQPAGDADGRQQLLRLQSRGSKQFRACSKRRSGVCRQRRMRTSAPAVCRGAVRHSAWPAAAAPAAATPAPHAGEPHAWPAAVSIELPRLRQAHALMLQCPALMPPHLANALRMAAADAQLCATASASAAAAGCAEPWQRASSSAAALAVSRA